MAPTDLRPLCIFDSAMKVGYDNAFDAIADAAETERRYNARLAREDFLSSNDGFAATLAEPELQAKVSAAGVERDRLLRQSTDFHSRVMGDVQRAHLEKVARMEERQRRELASIHERFEMTQQAALWFHAGRVFGK